MKKLIIKTALATLVLSSPLWAEAKADAMQECYAATQNMKMDVAAAMGECLNMKLEQSTTLLNTSYSQQRDKIEGIETIQNTAAIAALDDSQTAFMSFRESECKYKSLLEEKVENSDNAFVACKIQMNNWRAGQLSN